MTQSNPLLNPAVQQQGNGNDFTDDEVRLANRNSGIMLEMLRHDVTPAGAHYLLNHFDVPYVADAANWSLKIDGRVAEPVELSLAQLQQMPTVSRRVTLECAGNGRALITPRRQSMPWAYEAVGTAEWTGTPLKNLLQRAGVQASAVDVVFHGIDRGISKGDLHSYSRSLRPEAALHEDVLLVWAMNDQPLLPQHGFPLRLVVPGWYGMASVKWLNHIELIDHPFDGHQQTRTYIYRKHANDTGTPVTTMRVKSLMVPPGIPEWYSDRRLLDSGPVTLHGRAWSGSGTPITEVEVCDNGQWHRAELEPSADKYAWSGWHLQWQATPGEHLLKCRATDANGNSQPLEPVWDQGGFGNNGVQHVRVWCE